MSRGIENSPHWNKKEERILIQRGLSIWGWEVKIWHSDPISSLSEVGNKVMGLKWGGKEEDWRTEKSGEYLELSLQSRRCSEVEKYLDCVECGWGWEPCILNGANDQGESFPPVEPSSLTDTEDPLVLYTNSKSSLILSYFLFLFSKKGKMFLLWNGVFLCSLGCSALMWLVHIIHLWLFSCGCILTSWELSMCLASLPVKMKNQWLLWLKSVVGAKKLPL